MRITGRKLQAVIFDLDGVIADTVEFYYLANKMIAEKLGIKLTREENDAFRGIGSEEIIDELLKRAHLEISVEERENLRGLKRSFYQSLIEDISPEYLLKGIGEFIGELSENKVRIALASSSTNARFVLDKLKIIQFFHAIVDPTKLKKGKPHPEIFITAADLLQVPYENCAAIEDGEAGLKAILCTAMFSVSIGTSNFLRNADWNICSTGELNLKELREAFERGKNIYE